MEVKEVKEVRPPMKKVPPCIPPTVHLSIPLHVMLSTLFFFFFFFKKGGMEV
jgi:hypothetical protein